MTGRIPAAAYVFALVVYVVLGFTTKSLVLNWILGPLFPLLLLYVAPRTLARAFRR